VRAFDLRFGVLMDDATAGTPGEGWSVNFGRIPADQGTGEGGFAPLPGGLTIAFETRDTAEDPSSIRVSVSGVTVGNFPRPFAYSSGFRTVVIHWDSAGLDLTYDGKSICLDLPTSGVFPGVGDTFAFTARSTKSAMDVRIDNLKVTTQPLPAIDTGGPIISEFVADNGLFEDEFADKPDWIELFNGSSTPVSLEGWYLTDSKKNLTKWRLSGVTLSSYNYQVVFASGRDLAFSPTHWPHANFKLAKSGGYLALVRPDGKTVASAYDYGTQELNVSYGEKGAERHRGFMYPASPGAVNAQEPALAGLCPEPVFSHIGGLVREPIELTLTAPDVPGAEVRYTLDRTEPRPDSLLYTHPIALSQGTTVKARTFAPDYVPSRALSHTFVFLDDSLINYVGTGQVFESNLPLVFLDSFGVNVDSSTGGSRPFRPGYAVVIAPEVASGRASLMTEPEYAGPCGIHVRGESSASFDQRSYALELWDDAGADRDAPLLGMPADSDWVLYGPWSEKTLMRNKLVFDWMQALRGDDGTAVRTRFVEVFFNQSKPPSGRIGYSSYRGIFVLMEKLKRGKQRVPLENLNSKAVAPELITGGYIFRRDKEDALKNNWTTSRTGMPLQSYDPDRLNVPQFNYLKTYVGAFETALMSADFKNPQTGYRAFLDPDTFIDAQWLLEIAKQVDGYVFSTYFHKDRDGRLRAGPLWDFNISLGNADYGTGDRATGWLYDVPNGVGQNWYPRLHLDSNYKLAHWDRYWEMRRTIFASNAVNATIEGHMATLLDGYSGLVSNRAPVEIQNPVARHFRKWPRLGVRDWPNPPAETRIRTWQAEVEYMRNWLQQRLEWLDDQSLRVGSVVYRPPNLSLAGRLISAPIQVSMTPYHRQHATLIFPDGAVYYTTDNSDPRLPNGELSGKAIQYSESLTISSSVTINARLYAARQWSPLATATFLYDAVPASHSNLVISEILYQPAPPTPDEIAAGILNAQQFEFLELRNISRHTVNVAGVRISRGVDFDFAFAPEASRLLKAGESVVLVADRRAFSIRYPNTPSAKVVGQFRGHLDSAGDSLLIQAADGSVIREFRYESASPWPAVGDGTGLSLILNHPTKNPDPAVAFSWLTSAKTGGTPGTFGVGNDTFVGIPDQDTDGDGLADLFEFASGSDLENADSAFFLRVALTPLEIDGARSDYLTFQFRRQPTVLGLAIAVEFSDDLNTWLVVEPAPILVSSSVHDDGTVTETYRLGTPIVDDPKRSGLLRLRVRQQ
ncbi:MAG TPA: hypothetical protein DCE44_09770, partial [Verrucomicrobiales bacterium]|nr:hypothetical protein [Verrucomicrobiales bacterium]